MIWVEGIFLLVMGVLILAVAYQSLSRGWLPFGSNGLKGRLEIQRESNPAGYWAVMALYCVGGVGLLVYALLILARVCPPLPLR